MNDDWYLMYSAGAYGPNAFVDIFSVDRPGRALVMIPAYELFGDNPLYYNLSGYVLRLISALAFLWLLRMLFPRQHKLTFLTSLLFLVYPGFLSQPNGIDYQSHFVGLAAALLSIALTIRAVLTNQFVLKAVWHMTSIWFGLLYLSQMEWYIGFEIFRWSSIFLLSDRMGGTFFQKVWRSIRRAYPSIAVPGVFLIWRLFFFQSERGATDVDLQFEQVRMYPLQTLYHWAIQVVQDLFDVLVGAWAIPLLQLRGFIQQWGSVLAVLAFVIVLLAIQRQEGSSSPEDASQRGSLRKTFIFSLVITIGGLIPIAMVNRDVIFPFFSRYSLVSSAGVALMISAFLMMLNQSGLRNVLIALLISISVLTHHANTVKAAQQTAFTRDFWWQVSWRVPQLGRNTTLIANYPGVPLEEDYFIWGPANLIYYPEKLNEKNIQPGVFAALLTRETIEKIYAGERQEYDNRKTITTYANYRNILVLTQPSTSSCIHVLDGAEPAYSRYELDSIRLIGSYSELEHILADETTHTPPMVVFGPEPEHGWCYYYQKADLARQRGKWEKVLELGEQAVGQGLAPRDLIEWIPFLQAYAMTDNVKRLTELAPIITGDSYISIQACQIIGNMSDLPTDAADTVKSLYCLE
jgi:hypothetical protein